MKRKSFLAVFCLIVLGLSFSSAPVHAQDIQIHGFASQGYMWSDLNNWLVDSEDGSAEFNEAAINFQGRLTDNLRAGIQLFSKDMGDIGNNRVTLDWAFGDYRFENWLGVRFGRVKRMQGLYGETRDYDMLRVPIILPQAFYSDKFREVGGMLNGVNIYGSIPVGDIGTLDYQAFAGENSLEPDGDISTVMPSFINVESMDVNGIWGIGSEFNTNFGLRLSALYSVYQFETTGTVDMFFLGGPTGVMKVQADVESERANTIARNYAIEYTIDRLTLAGEYVINDGVERMWLDGNLFSRNNYDNEGWYAMISYQITDQLAGSVYYHEYYEDRDDKDGEDNEDAGGLDYEMWHKEWCASLRYDINEYWLFKVEGHSIDGLGFGHPDKDGTPHQHWSLFAVKTTFTF